MRKNNPSINGFVPRRSNERRDGLVKDRSKILGNVDSRRLHSSTGEKSQILGKPRPNNEIGRIDIDESLREIDNTSAPTKKLSRRQRRIMAQTAKKPRSKFARFLKWFVILLIIAGLSFSGYMLFKAISAGGNIFQGNPFDIFKEQELKKDSNGRSNFLILGTSEDDPEHGGANLTDSMLVLSIDQKNKNAYMFSVPRDLYVDYNMACYSGYSGKINAYFSCVNENDTKEAEQERLSATQKLVGDIFGLDIQYGVHVNHTVIKEAVDAVGGIDVDIQGSNGDPGILDRNFDWRCNYECYLVKYDNGVHHLDGKHALYLSQARGDVAPTHGLSNSNFDREVNQQKILVALRDKAVSTKTLTDINAVNGLIDTLGNNLRTNIEMAEIRTLMKIANEIKPADVHSISLIDSGESVVTTGNYNGASVVMPSAGMFDYTEIQSFIRKSITNDPVSKEEAPIVVLNGSGEAGLAKTKADELESKGFIVDSFDNAPDGVYENVEIYQIGSDNPATAKKLSDIFNVSVKTSKPPVLINGNIRFVIIFG